MEIRKSVPEDLDEIMAVFDYARKFMAENGNPNQWIDGYPERETVLEDIERGVSYIYIEENVICGTFAFIPGEDPTYREIDGKWLNEDFYGTIHRIAGNGKCHNLLHEALEYCFRIVPNIRIDTHADNSVMLHLLDKEHFKKCGIIKCHNGSERIAFQKVTDCKEFL